MPSTDKKKKEKVYKEIVIERWLARALLLSKTETSVSLRMDVVHYNAKADELVATDGRALLIVKMKPIEALIPIKLAEGDYGIYGDRLIQKGADRKENVFPEYQKIVPVKAKVICSGDIFNGIIECMVKGQVYLNIWKYASVLKILSGFSPSWVFTNDDPVQPVMMEADDSKYDIKYIIMPIRK